MDGQTFAEVMKADEDSADVHVYLHNAIMVITQEHRLL